MQALIAASLAALSFSPPALPHEASAVEAVAYRRPPVSPGKVAGQSAAGAAVGLLAGGAVLMVAARETLCECDDYSKTEVNTIALASPFVFAFGEAAGVYLVGRAVDGSGHGSFGRTFAGALLGTAAGAGITLVGKSPGAFAAGVTVATATTVFTYDRSRPRIPVARKPVVTVAPDLAVGGGGRDRRLGARVGVSF